jgi:hypothetical protein
MDKPVANGLRQLVDDSLRVTGIAAAASGFAVGVGSLIAWLAYLRHFDALIIGVLFLATFALAFVLWYLGALVGHKYLGRPVNHPFYPLPATPAKPALERDVLPHEQLVMSTLSLSLDPAPETQISTLPTVGTRTTRLSRVLLHNNSAEVITGARIVVESCDPASITGVHRDEPLSAVGGSDQRGRTDINPFSRQRFNLISEEHATNFGNIRAIAYANGALVPDPFAVATGYRQHRNIPKGTVLTLRAESTKTRPITALVRIDENESGQAVLVLASGSSEYGLVVDGLSAVMLEGQSLNQRLTSTNEPLETLEPAMTAWADKAEAWLEENLGIAWVARFRNGAGIPMGGFVMRRALNTRGGPLNGFMRVRLARLGEFLSESSQDTGHGDPNRR